jgi:hypothetical protein
VCKSLIGGERNTTSGKDREPAIARQQPSR